MDWNIAESQRCCTRCDCEFDDGDAYFSALYETSEAFLRKDFCPRCWDESDDDQRGRPFSFWQTEVPREEEPKKVFVDTNVIFDFFRQLAEEEHIPVKRNFRYILGLMLMRKKKLKLKDVVREDGKEYLVLRRSRTQELHRVLDPKLSEEELDQVKAELTQILETELV